MVAVKSEMPDLGRRQEIEYGAAMPNPARKIGSKPTVSATRSPE